MSAFSSATGAARSRFEIASNVSIMFTELPLLERFGAAAAAGFQSTEAWWPFPGAVPTDDEFDAFIRAVDESGIPLTGLNLWAGNMPAGDRGMVSRPDRRDDFEASLDVMVAIADRTGCRGSNALYGQRQEGMSAAEQDDTAIANLRLAVDLLGEVGTTVLIEPLSRGLNGAYPLETAADGIRVIERVREASGKDSIGLLFDTFHLANNNEDLVEVVGRHADLIEHVQLADTPGRGEPGSGTIDFPLVIDELAEHGYVGIVACEYAPTNGTLRSLDWIDTVLQLELTPHA